MPVSDKCHRRDQKRKRRCDQHQLSCRPASLIRLFLSYILRADHRASGCHSRKHLNHQHTNGIHQRHAGNRRLSNSRYHHHIRHAHQNSQKLLHQKRAKQTDHIFP
jgi:hypothetical protein